MNGGISSIGPGTRFAAPGGRWWWLVAVAAGATGVGLAGSLVLRQQVSTPEWAQPRAGAPPAATAPIAAVPVVAGSTAPIRDAVAVAPTATARRGLSIRPLGGGGGLLDVDGIDVDRRQAIDGLASATGTRLYGVESLPASLGRVTVQAAGVDRGAVWQRLLEGAAVGFASACDRRGCSVWFAPPATTTATAATAAATATAFAAAAMHPSMAQPPHAAAAGLVSAAAVVALPNAESTESEN